MKSSRKSVKNARKASVKNTVVNEVKQEPQVPTTAQEKRDWLKSISAELKAQQEMLILTGAAHIPTINEMLRTYYEQQHPITELNTFDQWREKGYQVRRGEKAYLFWGKPTRKESVQLTEEAQKAGIRIEDATEDQLTKTVADKDFYPLCYLFDISQCKKVEA